MNLADKVTASRLFMAPVFFIVFNWGGQIGLSPLSAAIFLWGIFILVELSDLLDGLAARRMKTVSGFGKLFDPFADVFARLTYFVCFAVAEIMPLWIFLVIIYREFSQLFLRQLVAEKGIAMGARPGGKVKAVFYMIAGAASLLLWTFRSLGLLVSLDGSMSTAVAVLYYAAAALSVGSFVDYLVQFQKISSRPR
jgi:CDP-diacylglycerol---glycerol-3-phosphate 3-phosphatidyltransferase